MFGRAKDVERSLQRCSHHHLDGALRCDLCHRINTTHHRHSNNTDKEGMDSNMHRLRQRILRERGTHKLALDCCLFRVGQSFGDLGCLSIFCNVACCTYRRSTAFVSLSQTRLTTMCYHRGSLACIRCSDMRYRLSARVTIGGGKCHVRCGCLQPTAPRRVSVHVLVLFVH